MEPSIYHRPGPNAANRASRLGMLAGLEGRWHGTGFNQIFLPDFDKKPPSDGPSAFRVLMNATTEMLDFTPIGGAVPNRGSEVTGHPANGQNDIDLFGLRYLQQISDFNSHEALHMEPGFWLTVPATKIPAEGPTIVRQGSIPHGTSILLQGSAFLAPGGKPRFATLHIPGMVKAVPPTPQPAFGYLDKFLTQSPPPPVASIPGASGNPNLVLEAAIAPHMPHIAQTVVLLVSSTPDGGVVNIPFLQNKTNNNAAVTRVESTFWIEHVVPPSGAPFDILQYSQTVIMNFLGIDWPHVSVATLFRQ